MGDIAAVIATHAAGRAASEAALVRRTYPEGRAGAPAPTVEHVSAARPSAAQHRFDTIGLPRHGGEW